MPRGDGTGPTGKGPGTGRAAGYCAGNATAGYGNPGLGKPTVDQVRRGGRGGGFARRNGFPVDSKTEVEILRRQVANLENMLKSINEQLTQLSERK